MPDATPSRQTHVGLAERWGFDPESQRENFARIARLAQTVAGTAMARVVLHDGAAFWSAGAVMPGPLSGVEDQAIRDLAIRPGESRWIEDASLDPATRDNPLVTGGPGLRLLASAPIVMSDGQTIGGLHVGDATPRAFDRKTAEGLRDLADLVAQSCERPQLRKDLARAAAEVAATAKVMNDFVECCPVALFMTDREFRIFQTSPRWREEMGLVDANIIGKTIWEIFPTSLERRHGVYSRVLAGATVRAAKTQLRLPDGRRPWVRTALTPWRGADGEIAGVLCMSHDISDMVEALERLERSERRLKLAAEISDVHVYEMDYVNRKMIAEGDFSAFFDHDVTYEDFWRNPTIGVHPDDIAKVSKVWADCQAAGQPFRAEYRRRVRGRDVWVFGGFDYVTDAEGRPKALTGVMQNITARKEAELALTHARDFAQAANRAKSEFLANMSHEIRTPLNGVMGVAGALARTELTPGQHDMVHLIETSAQTLESLLSDVLDLARIESGRLTLNIAPFSMQDAVGPVAALFEPSARSKGLDFRVDVAEAAKGVFAGDVARIRQILSNLISNAVKFTAKGAVRVTVSAKPYGEGASLIRFRVADSGIGFDGETQRRLFGRFEQADGSITRRFGGSGLGLAISRSLAEEMGGSLRAASEPGRGACFTFTVELPRREAARPADAPSALEAQSPSNACGLAPRVLLAEDHPTNRRVVELILGSIGVDLTSVANGQEALDAFASQAFDLVLMDMQMPVMDGLTAIQAIREQEAAEGRPRTPIYALTANAMPEHAVASQRAGADAHLTKPISAAELIAAVGRAAERVGERKPLGARADPAQRLDLRAPARAYGAMRSSDSPDVIIAGAGMAGATLALALARGGLRAVLVDPQPFAAQLAPTFDGRASAIAFSSFRAWDAIGAGDRLRPHAQRIEQILVTDGHAPGASSPGPPPFLLRFDSGEIAERFRNEPLGYMLENRRIRSAIAQAVDAAGIEVLAPARAERIQIESNAARVFLADGRVLTAPLVVGAEGRNSVVRAAIGINAIGWGYGQSGVVATVKLERPHGGVAHEYFLPSGPFAILPLSEDRVSLVWTERTQAAEALRTARPEVFHALLKRRFGPFLGKLEVVGPTFVYPLALQLAERLCAPRAALLGDAAHGIHPIAGQGLNLGLKDAAALAEVLVDAARLGEDIGAEAVLERYARWRRFDNVMLAAATDVFTRLFSNDNPALRLARGAGMAVVNRIGPARRFFMQEAGGAAGVLPRLFKGEAL